MMTLNEINSRIKSLSRRGKTFDNDIREVAEAALEHASIHGNHVPLSDLVNAMPKSGRTLALIKWISDHSPLNWNKEKSQFNKPRNASLDKYKVEAAKAVPFWEYTVEKEPGAVDINKIIAGLFARAEKAKDEGREVKGLETLEKIRAALAA